MYPDRTREVEAIFRKAQRPDRSVQRACAEALAKMRQPDPEIQRAFAEALEEAGECSEAWDFDESEQDNQHMREARRPRVVRVETVPVAPQSDPVQTDGDAVTEE